MTVLAPKLGQFARDYPDVVLDVTTDDNRLDLVAGGFDAGIHYGEFIEQDMVAVRVSRDHRPAIVGSPAYFESYPRPESPHDLRSHRCINFRHGSAGLYKWELDKGGRSLAVAVNGPLIVDDGAQICAAIDGGSGVHVDDRVPHLASGTGARARGLVPAVPGFFLYYPSRRQQPAALSALVDPSSLETERPARLRGRRGFYEPAVRRPGLSPRRLRATEQRVVRIDVVDVRRRDDLVVDEGAGAPAVSEDVEGQLQHAVAVAFREEPHRRHERRPRLPELGAGVGLPVVPDDRAGLRAAGFLKGPRGT
jgi:hypothetical protein